MPLFRSKKRKADEAALSKLKETGEGTYKTTARRADDPREGKRSALKRGTSVIFSKKTTTSPGTKERSTTQELVPSKNVTREHFQPQDRNPKTVNKRYTEGSVIKSLKERTEKGRKRQTLQDVAVKGGDIKKAGGYTIETPKGQKLLAYDSGRKKGELAGEYKKTNFNIPSTKQTLTTPGTPPTTKEKKNIDVKPPGKRKKITIAERGTAKNGQNYRMTSMTIHKKKKPDKTIDLFRRRVRTPGTPGKK